MFGCCSRATSWISRRKRSALTSATASGGRTLMTTRRPSARSSATKTRLILPPPSSRSTWYVAPRAACRREPRSPAITVRALWSSSADQLTGCAHGRTERAPLPAGRAGPYLLRDTSLPEHPMGIAFLVIILVLLGVLAGASIKIVG